MAVKMEIHKILWTLSIINNLTRGTSHWVVNESGLIQSKADSPFLMAEPNNLIMFLLQETYWEKINILHKNLKTMQIKIDYNWDKVLEETDINRQLGRDENCRKAAPVDLLDWHTPHIDGGLLKHIPPDEYQITDPSYGGVKDVPDCKKISSLLFSMSAFDHLKSVKDRHELAIKAESALPELVSPMMSVQQFGHWVYNILRQNSSSWLHYDLGSLYWRVGGNAVKAMECSRRALHYVSREYKDVPLLSMGTILHRSKRYKDAVIVLKAAVDHDRESLHAHYMLGNAYAMLGDYNNSVRYYSKCLKIDPIFHHAKKNRHGVNCLKLLFKRMEIANRTMANLRLLLKDYLIKEVLWLKTQVHFIKTMKTEKDFDVNNVTKVTLRMGEMNGLSVYDLKKNGDKNSVIEYNLNKPQYKDRWLLVKGEGAIKAAHSLEATIKYIEERVQKTTDLDIHTQQFAIAGTSVKFHGPLLPEFTVEPDECESEPHQCNLEVGKQKDDMSEYEVGPVRYPTSMKINRHVEEFDREPDWPFNKMCKEQGITFTDNIEIIYPVFLPFENKGLKLTGLLSDSIGVPMSEEHALPWHPPHCPSEKSPVLKKANKKNIEVMVTDFLRQKLTEYVEGGVPLGRLMHDAELGQRMQTAMDKNIAPKWLIYTFTSLYWRVRQNNMNALICLLAASETVQSKYKDLVLTSLSSVYLEMGYVDEAFRAAEEAFKLSLYEPATNFIVAQINMIKKYRNTQMFHLKQVIRVEPNFMDGLARSLLLNWACFLKQVTAIQELENETCAEMETGVSIVCEKDGSNCRVSNIPHVHCSKRQAGAGAAAVRLLEFKQNPIPGELNVTVLDPFILKMPLEKTDKEEHQENFDLMLSILNDLRGCGPNGCSSFTAESLKFEKDSCQYDYLNLDYWLNSAVFRDLFTDEIRLSSEIGPLAPSQKKFPECRVYTADDFFLDKIEVTVDGWDPLLSLVKHFADMFEYNDFVGLGSKIARYVESNPRCWRGLVAAGWWCGAAGRGGCALRCLSSAHVLAPIKHKYRALRSLAALLHLQKKHEEGKKTAYLAFYALPKSKVEAFLLGSSHLYQAQYEQALWMFRYALSLDDAYIPARASIYATFCFMLKDDKPLNTYA